MEGTDKQPYTVCFTGHRKLIHPKEVIKQKLITAILPLIQQGYTYYQVGMALGFDMLAAETILALKKVYPLRLLAILPCPPGEQTKGWKDIEKSQYQSILSQADETILVSPRYNSGCMFKRNRFLINTSSICIAYQYRNTGGTAYTTNYAKQYGIKVLFLSVTFLPEQQ